MAASGPPRRFAATRHDRRYPAHRVMPVGAMNEPSRTEALRTATELCSSLPLTHYRPERLQHGVAGDHRTAEILDVDLASPRTNDWLQGRVRSAIKIDR